MTSGQNHRFLLNELSIYPFRAVFDVQIRMAKLGSISVIICSMSSLNIALKYKIMTILHILDCAGGVERYLEMLVPRLKKEGIE